MCNHFYYNFSNRNYQLLYVTINGTTVINIKVPPLIILNFGLPPISDNEFYQDNVVNHLAALLRLKPVIIRRVTIVKATSSG